MRGMKLCAVGKGAQWNSASLEKTHSEIKPLRRRRVMHARYIGDDFTSLLYIAVTSSVFLYKLPITEEGAWPLTPTSPHPDPFPPITVGHPSSLWRGGVVAHPPDPNPPPKHWRSAEKSVDGGWELWGGGVWEVKLPPQFSSPIQGLPADHQCLGGGGD